MAFKSTEELRGLSSIRGRKPGKPKLSVFSSGMAILSRAACKAAKTGENKAVVEIDESGRLVRVKASKDKGRSISAQGQFSVGVAAAKCMGCSEFTPKLEIMLSYNDEDGWWYGSY